MNAHGPHEHDSPPVQITRRRFVQYVGGALTLAGLPACSRPLDRILPYVDQPPELRPGEPERYATAMSLDGFGTGLLVESRDGRPVKVEGNPLHPASLGAAGILEQGSILSLYDPSRLRRIHHGPEEVDWATFAAAFAPGALVDRVGQRGAGLRLLMEPDSSPTNARLYDQLRDRYPDAGIHFYSPFAPAGHAAPPGLVRQHDLLEADVVLAVNADFLASGPFHLRHARAFASGRVPDGSMKRLYALESAVTVTGAAADHRFAARPGDIEPLLRRLLSALRGGSESDDPEWMAPLARDLGVHRGRSLLIAGPRERAVVHGLVDTINRLLENEGRTTWLTPSPLYRSGDADTGIASLTEAMEAGDVSVMLSIGVNACHSAPGTLGFPQAIERVAQVVYLGTHDDETAARANWTVPLSHYLESWGDVRAHDGTRSVVQPLIHPLYESVTATSMLALLVGDARRDYDLVRATWRQAMGDEVWPEGWTSALSAGVWQGSASPRVPRRESTRLPFDPMGSIVIPERMTAEPDDSGASGARPRAAFEVVVVPDAGVHDGRFANNAWLQELPRPLTTLTWGNVAHVSPENAARLGIRTGDVLKLEHDDRALEIPAFVQEGVAGDVLVIATGFGRRRGAPVAAGVGTDIFPIWPGTPAFGPVVVERTGRTEALAVTQDHWSLEGRDVARSITAMEASLLPERDEDEPESIYRNRPAPILDSATNQWAMTIDLSRCTGCSACVIACQAENNVPSVGREGVLAHREMHWLRIDQYRDENASPPARIAQPMLCQHCEKAPCEYVCPVAATTHSPDGLNEMTYNRCVGTRFCSNNCPYKVRRYNWFDYNDELDPVEMMAKNPHVTVRERGVMEKCTFCVQRIREAEINAAVAGRPLGATEVRTACQQSCPTEAIQFGSLTEPGSPVVALRARRRAYDVLDELGTRPRVRYLARVRTPNPGIPEAE